MRHLWLTEGGPARSCQLREVEARWLAAAELAVVSWEPGAACWSVAPGRRIGTIRIGDLQVSVLPKIPVERMVFLMGYARQPAFWRDHSVLLEIAADLPEALAHALVRLAGRAIEQGLLQGYRTVDESAAVLRGRIRVSEQIARRFGRGLPLEVTYDEFTVDIAENRILLAACVRLLRAPGVSGALRRSLQRLRARLAEVTLLDRADPLPTWVPSRLNARYHSVLHLAEVVLSSNSFEQRPGGLEVSAFVVDMWKVFEDFVTVAITQELRGYGGRVALQDRRHLDRGNRVHVRPDLVWSYNDGQPRLVLDAKYKSERPAGFPHADLYQLLAYCTVLGLSDGHLVYARGEDEAIKHEVVGTRVTIWCHTLDLSLPPAELLTQVADLSQCIASTSDTAPTSSPDG